MKKVLVLPLLAICTISLFAQSQTGSTSFNRSPQPAVIYNLPYSEEAVLNGVENKMSTYGKPKKVKGFLMYKNVLVPDISKEPLTFYFNGEKKSSKDDSNAVLTMVLSNEFDRFYAIEENSELYGKAKKYLDSFEPAVSAAALELKITQQEESIIKADKKLKSLRDNSINFDKQKKKLEEKIAQNAQEITTQEQQLARQREELELLIQQRKN